MAKKRNALMASAAAFAASPQGKRLIQQAKEYAQRPENRERAQRLLAQAQEYARRPENRERAQRLLDQARSLRGNRGSGPTPPPGR